MNFKREFPIGMRVEVRGRPAEWYPGVVVGHTKPGNGCIVHADYRTVNPGGYGAGHIRHRPAVVQLADIACETDEPLPDDPETWMRKNILPAFAPVPAVDRLAAIADPNGDAARRVRARDTLPARFGELLARRTKLAGQP